MTRTGVGFVFFQYLKISSICWWKDEFHSSLNQKHVYLPNLLIQKLLVAKVVSLKETPDIILVISTIRYNWWELDCWIVT